VRPARRGRLVAALGQVGTENRGQLGAVRLVMGEQRADFPLHERGQPRVVAQQVQQPAQPQVRQPVVGPGPAGRRRLRGGVRDLLRFQQRAARVGQGCYVRPDPDRQVVTRQPPAGGRADRAEGRVAGYVPVQGQQGTYAFLIERADQRGDPLVAARVGEGVAHLGGCGVGRQAPSPVPEPDHHGQQLPPGDLDA